MTPRLSARRPPLWLVSAKKCGDSCVFTRLEHDVALSDYTRGVVKSLARLGRKQVTATVDFDFHIYPIYNHNWRNTSTIYIYI